MRRANSTFLASRPISNFRSSRRAIAPRADLAWRRLSLQGHWHGSLSAPKSDAHLAVEQLQLPGGTHVVDLTGELTADAGKASVRAVINGLRLPGSNPQLLQGSPVTVDATLQLDKPSRPIQLSLAHRLFTLRGSADTSAADGGRRSAELELTLPDLAPLAALAGQVVRGSGSLSAHLQNENSKTLISIDSHAALVAGTEFWSGAVGDRPTLQVTGTIREGSVTVDGLRFTGRAASLTGSGELSGILSDANPLAPATVRAKWALDISQLGSLYSALTGTLKASGSFDGSTSSLAASARLSSSVSVRGSPSGTLTADVNLHGLPSALGGTLEAHGALDGAPLHVDVSLERDAAGSLRTQVHRADWKSVHAEGDITVASAAVQSHGQLNLEIPQLADLQHLLGMDVAGSLNGTVALHADRRKALAQLHLDAHELTLGSFHGSAQLAAEGAPDSLGFDLDLQAPALRGADASLSAHGVVDIGADSFSFIKAVAHYRGQDAQLLSPVRISWANGISVDDLQLGAQQAVFVLKGRLSPALDVNASLRQVRPSLINAFVPGLLASGTLEASARLQGSLSAPTGELDFTATGVTLSDQATFGLPLLDARASAHLTGNGTTIDAHLTAGALSHLAVVGQAPSGTSGSLALKINGEVDVAMLNPLLEARGQQAGGVIGVNATVGGSVKDPQIGGTVTLNKGSITDYGRGLSLTDIVAVMTGSAGMLQIQSLNAKAGPGTVSISGSVGVLQPAIPVSLHVTARHAQPIASKLVTATLNADLKVGGTARERLDVSGTVDLGRTLIGIPNRLPPNVAVLDVRRRGQTAAVQRVEPLVIGLDIAVRAPQEFLVQGRGLDAEMGGDMHLSGTVDEPAVTGGFDLQRGSVSVGGSKLSFTAGRVSFNGAGLRKTIDPTLDFTAQSTVGGVTATLHITGLADAPNFEFTSNPTQPPDEIMALLMFGTPAAQLSALQLAQVGATLAIMSGAGGDSGLNPLVKLQQSFGLDRLNVGAAASTGPTTENSGASIAAGRYIAKRVYIEAKQSTTGTSQVEADVDLTKHLKLQTRLGNGTASVQGTTPENDPGSSVGLTYQIEY